MSDTKVNFYRITTSLPKFDPEKHTGIFVITLDDDKFYLGGRTSWIELSNESILEIIDDLELVTAKALNKLRNDLLEDEKTIAVIATELHKSNISNKESIESLKDTVVSKSNRIVKVNMEETSATIDPNKLYLWNTVDSLNITLNEDETSEYVNMFMLRFTAGPDFQLITTDDIIWNGDEPSWTEGTKYEINIVDKLATYGEFKEVTL